MRWVLLKKNKTIEGQTATTATKGLATGSWTRVPTTTAEMKAETSYVLYDAKFRPIRNYTTNYLGGFTCTDSKLDAFSGQLQYTLQKHKRTSGDAELTVKEAFTYSAQNRLLTHTHQINGGAEQLLADNTYDELGKLTSKKVGNTSATPLQNVNYSYNVRGWLTKINEIGSLQQGTDPADLFSFKLNYNTIDGDTAVANKLYNGNIAETFWSTAIDGGFVRNYGYKYDSLNRLKDATYQKSGQVTGMYNENLSYDKNGNIKNLSRYGDRDEQYLPIQIDNLGYTYATNSNKLLNVADTSNNTSGFNDFNKTGDDYAYDANGNMTVDNNKHITGITYNHLNLPTKIIFPTGNIVYIYNASGQKMQKIVTEGTSTTTTDYLGGYQYKNTVLQFFPTAEGYVKNTPVSGTNSYSYVFNYTDHLGNVRLSYTKNPSTNALTILEENSYYPFGLKHNGYNVDNFQPDYKYKFQGQERQDELGLNWDSFKWRNYDYAIGRFMCIDPLAEKYPYNGTYNFSEDRVIDGRELEGLEVQLIVDKGNYAKADVGHTFVSVGSGKNMTVYTYGRWAGTDGNSLGSHSPLNNGNGVMVKLVGKDALAEVQKYVKDGAEVYDIKSANENKVKNTLETDFQSSDKTPDTGKYKGDERAHVIDKYDLSENNCTTKSLEAVNGAIKGGEIKYQTTIVSGGLPVIVQDGTKGTYAPKDLNKQLNQASQQSSTNVVKVTDKYEK